MATVNAFVRVSADKKSNREVNVRFRLSDGRKIQLSYKSDIKIMPEHFDAVKQQYKSRVSGVNGRKIYDTNVAIAETKQKIIDIYNSFRPVSSSDLARLMNERDNNNVLQVGFFDLFDMFLREKRRAVQSVRNYNSLARCLRRYEAYKQIGLSPEIMDKQLIVDFQDYLLNEWAIVRENSDLLSVCGESRAVEKRSLNTVSKQLKALSAFLNWLVSNRYLVANPMLNLQKPHQIYGTPFFLTIEEREQLYRFDFSSVGRVHLNEQRDVFVFQCLIGCRVSDLQKLSRANVRDGFIEYIAAKTIGESPRTIRVPLSKTAQEILERYSGLSGGRLLPFISSQRYNDAIKDMLRLAGIDRMVTILNPMTRQEVSKPIYEVASSHMARRTFIGNLYNKVQDPNLIGSMSGHAEGSRAFARYRAIGDEVKRSVIGLID